MTDISKLFDKYPALGITIKGKKAFLDKTEIPSDRLESLAEKIRSAEGSIHHIEPLHIYADATDAAIISACDEWDMSNAKLTKLKITHIDRLTKLAKAPKHIPGTFPQKIAAGLAVYYAEKYNLRTEIQERVKALRRDTNLALTFNTDYKKAIDLCCEAWTFESEYDLDSKAELRLQEIVDEIIKDTELKLKDKTASLSYLLTEYTQGNVMPSMKTHLTKKMPEFLESIVDNTRQHEIETVISFAKYTLNFFMKQKIKINKLSIPITRYLERLNN